MLKGEQVTLKPLEMSDVDTIVERIHNVEFYDFTSRATPITRIEVEKGLKAICSGGKYPTEIAFGIYTKAKSDDECMIGLCGLKNIKWFDRNCVFYIQIFDSNLWGKGYGTEATKLVLEYTFKRLSLHRIKSVVYAYNKSSLALHKKFGFITEGTECSVKYKNGKYHDAILFRMLKNEYIKNVESVE